MILGADGPLALLDGPVCRKLERALVAALDRARRDGLTPDRDVLEAVAEVRAVAAAHRGDGVPTAALAELPSGERGEDVGHEDLGIVEAAHRLGCGTRNARALASRHGIGRLVGGRWRFDPEDLESFIERRG